MTTSRERVLQALNFQPTDRVPRDLGGMRSTNISAFAYPKLIAALGLPPRLPRVEDTGQMLALPDLDVLDALGCDVVSVLENATNAFEQPELWKPYDFDGRLPALVRNPAAFTTLPDGTIIQDRRRMPPSSTVFDEEHGGQALNLANDLPKPDLAEVKRGLAARLLRDDQIVAIRELCRRVRESSDRAVFFNNGALNPPICIHGWGGLAIFPIICITEPDFVTELHEIATEFALKNVRALLPEIAPYVDIIMMAADDWGTQNNTIASPKVYRSYSCRIAAASTTKCTASRPQVKTFLHSCGAIYTLIDLIIESGFDILNPVQWTAGKQGYRGVERAGEGAHHLLGRRRPLAGHPAAGHGRGCRTRGARGRAGAGRRRRVRLLQHPQHPGRDRAGEGDRDVPGGG